MEGNGEVGDEQVLLEDELRVGPQIGVLFEQRARFEEERRNQNARQVLSVRQRRNQMTDQTLRLLLIRFGVFVRAEFAGVLHSG